MRKIGMTTEGVSLDAQLFRKVRLEKDLRSAMGVVRESLRGHHGRGGEDEVQQQQKAAAGVDGGAPQEAGGVAEAEVTGATAEILQLLRSIDERVRRLEEGGAPNGKPSKGRIRGRLL